jgi:hypothetical protein
LCRAPGTIPNWKLNANKNTFKEAEILEQEWGFSYDIGCRLDGGGYEFTFKMNHETLQGSGSECTVVLVSFVNCAEHRLSKRPKSWNRNGGSPMILVAGLTVEILRWPNNLGLYSFRGPGYEFTFKMNHETLQGSGSECTVVLVSSYDIGCRLDGGDIEVAEQFRYGPRCSAQLTKLTRTTESKMLLYRLSISCTVSVGLGTSSRSK